MVVEGETESAFVRKVLDPHLLERGIRVRKCIIMGQEVKLDLLRRDVTSLLTQHGMDICSTMFDYYALPADFPGKGQITAQHNTLQKAEIVETALRNEVERMMSSSFDPHRFIPYVQMHEFEGLLFSDPSALAQSVGKPELKTDFDEIRQSFDTPEDINDRYDTCPSRRIKRACRYDKPASGVTAAKVIGLEKIRKECPHFSAWVAKLESLGDKA
jgi:hypothetical protein